MKKNLISIWAMLLLAVFLLWEPVRLTAQARSLLFIDSQTGEPYESSRLSLIAELAKHGYSETSGNLRLAVYSLANNNALLSRVISMEADRLNHYDVIIVSGTIALLAAKDAWYGQPSRRILFMNVTDPVAAGVIDSFQAPPSANFSGIAYPVPVRERLRFLKAILPEARRIGYLYADMPQSASYTAWLEEILLEPEFKNLQLVRQMIEFVPGENGPQRMAMVAAGHAARMDSTVDVFLTPNDQMGIHPDFTRRLAAVVSKPIMALGDTEMRQKTGALFSVYPDTVEVGRTLAAMVIRMFGGATIRDIGPLWAPYSYILDREQVRRFGVQVPLRYQSCLY